MLGKDVQEAELQEQMEKMKDPVIQQQERQLDLKQAQIEERSKSDAARIAADVEKSKMRDALERERIESQRESTKLQATIDLSKEVMKEELENKKLSAKEKENTARDAAEGARTAVKIVEAAAKLSNGKKKE